MSFLAPLMFAFGLSLPVIVTLYLLKLKRQRHEISSTLLWLRSIQDLTANAPFQRLRNNLLLWLQLLVAALAVFALARPFLALDTERNQTMLVFIDNSASMQATDTEGFMDRLDQARALALEIVDSLGPDDVMLPISFNSRTQTLVSTPTADRAELRRAIHDVRPTDRPTDFRDSLTLIRSLTEHVSNPEVIVITDGALGEETEDLIELTQGDDAMRVRYLRCGSSGENAGIVAFSLSRGLEDQSRVELFAEVANQGTEPVQTTLELFLEGDRIDAKSLSIEPQSQRGVVFANVGDIAGALRLQLNAEDDLAIDNVAHGILSPQRDLRVLLVSERQNPFVTGVLMRQDALSFARTEPEAYEPDDAAERYDLVILDGHCPEELPEGNYIIFDAPPPIEGFEARDERIEFPPVVDWDRTSPLTRFADFSLITVAEVIDYTPPVYAHTLVETNRGPLISLIERGATSILFIGFDPYQSDWPWLVSFPVFMTNAIQHVRARAGAVGQFSVPTGDAIHIPVRRETRTMTLTQPGGSELELDFAPGTPVYYFTNTDSAGLYQITDDQARQIRFATSLLSPRETAILPAPEIGLRGEGIEAETEVVRANTEIWKPLAWLALLVLCVEWFIYLRRSWA